LITREAVANETPASCATCLKVIDMIGPFPLPQHETASKIKIILVNSLLLGLDKRALDMDNT